MLIENLSIINDEGVAQLVGFAGASFLDNTSEAAREFQRSRWKAIKWVYQGKDILIPTSQMRDHVSPSPDFKYAVICHRDDRGTLIYNASGRVIHKLDLPMMKMKGTITTVIRGTHFIYSTWCEDNKMSIIVGCSSSDFVEEYYLNVETGEIGDFISSSRF